MTVLISKQLWTMLIMAAAGICTGMVRDTFSLFVFRFLGDKDEYLSNIAKIVVKILECMVIAYLISEFAFYGQNGKLTFSAIGSFFAGLLLWSKYFCGTITIGENNEQKR